MAGMQRLIATATLAALAACAVADAAPAAPPPKRTTVMHDYAFLFRPTRSVEPGELPRRNAAARDWAIARRQEGRLNGASPLEDQGVKVTRDAVTPLADARAVAAVLVLRAPDLESAVALAKGHPGLAFGTEIEVRPVKAIVAPAP